MSLPTEPGYLAGAEIDGILFDLDDTLSDYASTRDAAVLTWTRAMPGWRLPDDETTRRWAELEETWFERYTRGELSLTQQRAGRVRDFLPDAADWSDEAAVESFDQLRAIYEASWRPFPDARDALQRALASGRPVGILTNGETAYQTRKMRELGLLDDRLVMAATSDLPAAKPDVRAFHAACAKIGTEPGRTLMIGDNPATDVAGGLAAGLTVVQLCRNGEPPVARHWVQTLDQIGFVDA